MDLQNKEVIWDLVVFSPDSHLLAGYSYEEDCMLNELDWAGIEPATIRFPGQTLYH